MDDSVLFIFGVLVVYIYQKKISLNKIKYFSLVFLVLFIFSPTSYYYISVTENNKRTDYPGKKISRIVQTEWEKNFKNEILVVAGDEWHGGNLSYHLKSRPIWDNILNNKKKLLIKDPKSGIIVIGEADILSKICKTVFLKVENQGICMLGVKK